LLRVRRSILDGRWLAARVGEEFELGEIERCWFVALGVNDHYALDARAGSFVLRIYRRSWRTVPEIEFELDALAHLREYGVSVAAPVARRSGSRILTLELPEGRRYAVLFERARGAETTASSALAGRYGEAAAALHLAAAGISTEVPGRLFDLPRELREGTAVLRSVLGNRPADLALALDLAERLAAAVEVLPAAELDHGFCHGDLNGGNASLDGDRLTLYDFDFCGMGFRAYDLAPFLRKADLHLGADAEAAVRAFLDGYCGVRPLGAADREALPLLVAVRQLWVLEMQAGALDELGAAWWLEPAYLDRRLENLHRRARELGLAGAPPARAQA
jgi:Ser/Thr protein kinase RdoA (MazF antagonist)